MSDLIRWKAGSRLASEGRGFRLLPWLMRVVTVLALAATVRADILLSPSGTVDLGSVVVGQSASKGFTLTNSGLLSALITSVKLTGTSFSLSGSTCGTSLGAGQTCRFVVNYSPTATDARAGLQMSAQLSVLASVATSSPVTIRAMPLAAAAPTLSVSPSGSIDFGGVTVGTSLIKTLTLSNTGTSDATGISVGTLSAPLNVSHNCPTTLSANATCTIKIEFAPRQIEATVPDGKYSGRLVVSGSVTVSGAPVSVSAQAVTATTSPKAILSLSPSGSVDLGSVIVGSLATKVLTLTNTGNAAASSINIGALPAPLGVASTCPAVLDAGASCSITLGFAPKLLDPPTPDGKYSGTVGVTANVSVTGSPIAVNAVAVQNPSSSPQLSLSPTGPLDFGKVTAGSVATRVLVLANNGSADASLGNMGGLSAPFSLGNGCPTILRAGTSCALTIGFSPRSSDVATFPAAVLKIDASSPVSGSPYSITGTATADATGTAGAAALVIGPPGPFDFGKVLVGQTAVRVLQITNTGGASASLTGMTGLAAPFQIKNSCPATLPAGGSCQISVGYAPSATDPASNSATLQIAASVPVTGSPYVFTASNGTGGAVGLGLAPVGPYNFGPVQVGESATATLQLRNSSLTPATITSIGGLSGSFGVQHQCPASLAPGATCSVQVMFKPTTADAASAGDVQAQLTVVSSPAAAGSPYGLSGKAQIGVPAVTLSPSGAVDFGSVAIGQSASRTLTLTNTGAGATRLSAPSLIPPYSATSDCSSQLAAGSSCKITLQYAPAPSELIAGSPKGRLNIAGLSVELSGQAIAGSKSELALTPPGPFVFGPIRVGEIGNRILTLSNTGGNAVAVTGFSGLSKPFSLKHNCPASLDAGKSCQLAVSYAPTSSDLAGGTTSAQLSVVAGGTVSGAPYVFSSAPAAASDAVPVLVLSPTGPFSFGSVTAGTVSTTTLTLSNTGKAAARINGFPGLTNPFSSFDNCPSFLRPGESCKIQVRFAPTNSDVSTATLASEMTVAASTAVSGSPYAVTGTASSATVAETPTAFQFDAAKGVDLGAIVQSNAVTISGITKPVLVQVSNGQYSINGGDYTSSAGAVRPGDSLRVRVTAASDYSTAATATLTAGGVSADFTATTLAKTFTLSGTGISNSNVVVQPTGADKSQSLALEVTLGDVAVSDSAMYSSNGFADSSSAYKVYVASLLPSGVLGVTSTTMYVKDVTANWVGVGSPLSAYLENVSLNSQDTAIKLDILSDLDFGLISGAEFYIGYGISDSEMLSSGRYRAFYKVP